VVFYPNGFAIFTVDNITYYPADKIVSFVETKISDRRVLCNILQLRDWIENVVPIFGFDKQNFIHMKNNSNKLVVTAESAVSGVAVVEQEGTCDNDFEVIMDASYVKDIPSSYDCFVAEGQLDRLVLSDGEGGVIILMGAKG
ncbi:MAG: hypothetical protein KKD77_22405, partial [Gammaproteobacteria bacterium]|nr:hypothetical protein [Gammaproteobacteria bacterium]